jgi:hypothetical protein
MKESAAYIGRVGGLAVALGVGAWLAATPRTAAADTGSAAVDSVVSDPSVLLAPAAAAAAGPGLDVADLDSFLKDIGLGSLVTNNDFFLETDSTQSIGEWLLGTSSIELFNALSGLDETTLTTALIVDFAPAAQDLGDILNGTGDLSTELSQLAPDLTQGFDGYLQAATELFLSA